MAMARNYSQSVDRNHQNTENIYSLSMYIYSKDLKKRRLEYYRYKDVIANTH